MGDPEFVEVGHSDDQLLEKSGSLILLKLLLIDYEVEQLTTTGILEHQVQPLLILEDLGMGQGWAGVTS